jgi:hypothetical protein
MKEFLATFSGFHPTIFSFLAVHSPQQFFHSSQPTTAFFHSHSPTKQTLIHTPSKEAMHNVGRKTQHVY